MMKEKGEEKEKRKKDKDDWFMLEEIPNAYLYLLSGPFKGWTKFFKEYIGLPIHISLGYKNNILRLYCLREELHSNAKKLFQRINNEPGFLSKIDKINKKSQKDLFNISKKISKIKFNKLNNEQLLKVYFEFTDVYIKSFYSGWIDNVLEFENEIFSTYLKEYLEKKANEKGINSSELFPLFSTPNRITFGLKQEQELIKIINFVKKDSSLKKLFEKDEKEILKIIETSHQNLNKMFDKHTKKYCWHFFMYKGPAYNKLDFIKAVKSSLDKEENSFFKNNLNQKKKIFKILDIDKRHQLYFKQASEMVFNKDLRKHGIYFGLYNATFMFNEIANRLNITLENVRNLFPWEMEDILIKNKKLPNFKDREEGILVELFNGKAKIKRKVEANKFINKIELKQNNIELKDELNGSCAFHGKVKGIVKLINLTSDMVKMNNGDILVSHQTNPDLLPAMKKASAFVTDIGGITCHAAIVAREMRKPCIVGTKIATKVFKDGDVVEVDADNGVVKKI